MLKQYILVMLAFLSLLFTASANAVQPQANPLEGTWEWTNIKNSCVETYIFAADGTGHITSGSEISIAQYEIDKTPTPKGFYKVVLTIKEDQGGTDCSEDVSNNTGESYTKYLMFHPSGGQYVSCDKETTDSCVGPLQRVR